MPTHGELVALAHSLRSERVLSVYIDPSIRNPASRKAWRVQLAHSLKEQRALLADSPHHEREQFERCVTILLERLPEIADSIERGGWVAFITPGGVMHAEQLPVPTPTVAVWSTGIFVAPYVRALKQSRPVVVAVADARKASIYRYLDDHGREIEDAVRAALEQAALVEEVSGEAARRLDEHGGVAARLRYRSHAT